MISAVSFDNGEEEARREGFTEEASLLQGLAWRLRTAPGKSLTLLFRLFFIFYFLLPFLFPLFFIVVPYLIGSWN